MLSTGADAVHCANLDNAQAKIVLQYPTQDVESDIGAAHQREIMDID